MILPLKGQPAYLLARRGVGDARSSGVPRQDPGMAEGAAQSQLRGDPGDAIAVRRGPLGHPGRADRESCPTKIFLPNEEAGRPAPAEHPGPRDLYEAMGLNETQIEIIRTATKKRHYYLVSPEGRRLFDLGLGPICPVLRRHQLERSRSPTWIALSRARRRPVAVRMARLNRGWNMRPSVTASHPRGASIRASRSALAALAQLSPLRSRRVRNGPSPA